MLQNAAGAMIAKAYDQWYKVNFKTPRYLLTKREMSRRQAGGQVSKQASRNNWTKTFAGNQTHMNRK
jgi:hypothetical protein